MAETKQAVWVLSTGKKVPVTVLGDSEIPGHYIIKTVADQIQLHVPTKQVIR